MNQVNQRAMGVTKQKSIFEKFTEKLKKFLEDAEKIKI